MTSRLARSKSRTSASRTQALRWSRSTARSGAAMLAGDSPPMATWYSSGWKRWKLRRSSRVTRTGTRAMWRAVYSPPKPPPTITTLGTLSMNTALAADPRGSIYGRGPRPVSFRTATSSGSHAPAWEPAALPAPAGRAHPTPRRQRRRSGEDNGSHAGAWEPGWGLHPSLAPYEVALDGRIVMRRPLRWPALLQGHGSAQAGAQLGAALLRLHPRRHLLQVRPFHLLADLQRQTTHPLAQPPLPPRLPPRRCRAAAQPVPLQVHERDAADLHPPLHLPEVTHPVVVHPQPALHLPEEQLHLPPRRVRADHARRVPVQPVAQQDLLRLDLLARLRSLIRREDRQRLAHVVDVQRLRPRPVAARVLASPRLGPAAALVSPPRGQAGAQLDPGQRLGVEILASLHQPRARLLAGQHALGVGRRDPVEAAPRAGGTDLLGLVGGVAQHQHPAARRDAHGVDHASGQVGRGGEGRHGLAGPGRRRALLAVLLGVIRADAGDAWARRRRDEQAEDEDVVAPRRRLLLPAVAAPEPPSGVAAGVGVLGVQSQGGVGGLVEDEQPVA